MKAFKNTILICFSGFILLAVQSCDNHCINGNGNTVTQARVPGNFSGISFSTDGSVYISQDSVATLTVTAQQNVLDDLITAVHGDELQIYNDHCLRGNVPVVVTVTSPTISDLCLSGEGSMVTSGKIYSDELNISLSGTGSFNSQDYTIATNMSENLSGTGVISLLATCTSMNSSNSGSGTINISGSSASHAINTSGSGDLHGYGFITNTTTVNISGSSNVEIFVNDALDVTISGSGNVYYKGFPVVTTHISGSGSVIHVN